MTHPAEEPLATPPAPGQATGQGTGQGTGQVPARPTGTPPSAPAGGDDPLRGSLTSGLWAALVAFGVVLVLLVVFIAQNTDPVLVRFLGLEGETPLAVALLVAVAAGLLLTALAGTARLWQVRRRVRREAKAGRR